MVSRNFTNAAWKKFSAENMRGKRVNGWYVITHIRDGKWKCCRVNSGEMITKIIRLDYWGKVMAS